ncbi:MAG: SBBP repeat-containing protein [Flavobacteriales bacterium]|nr:SBBP repeat-containing protein [Flavobacteriales bacterium]
MKKFILFTLIFTSFHALKAQQTCATAVSTTPTATCNYSTHTTTGTEYWLKFVASSPTVNISLVTVKFGINATHIHNLALYSGNCSSPVLVADDELPFVADAKELAIDLNASGLVIGQTYYLRAARKATHTDCDKATCKANNSSNPTTFDICVEDITVIIPKDFGIEPPAISHSYTTNRGQLVDVNGNQRPEIKLYTINTNPQVLIAEDKVSYVFSKIDTIPSTPDTLQRVDMTLVGGNSTKVFKTEQTNDVTNYFLAHIPNGVVNNKAYSRAVCNEVYQDIDMQFYSNNDGLKYYFIVKPGGDPDNIIMKFDGATAINVTASGGLEIVTPLGTLDFEPPHAYRVNPAGNVVPMPWQAKFEAIPSSTNQVKFKIHNYDPIMPLFIQIDRGHSQLQSIASLEWSTYYGGSNPDLFLNAHTDAASNLYITGYNVNNNFPVSSGTYQGFGGGSDDAVVLKFKPNGERLWATYVGGAAVDRGTGIAVDPSGNVFVTGWTTSTNFPTTGGNPGGGAYYQAGINTSAGSGFPDAFMVKLNSAGNASSWRTYYGGGGGDYANSIAVDGSGNVFITGKTEANNFPVKNLTGGYYQSALAGPYLSDVDVFIVKFSGSNLNNVWSTYYGGTNSGVSEEGKGITVDQLGNVYVTGRTPSTDFPKLNPGGSAYYDGTLGGSSDAFLLKFNNNGVRSYASYFGGSFWEIGNAVVTDGGLGVYITGITFSNDLPTQPYGSGFFQGTIGSTGGVSDAFILKLGSDMSRQWATYYGGSGIDEGLDIDVNSTTGNISLTGRTQSSNLPLVTPAGAYSQTYAGGDDAYIASFGSFSLTNTWATYLGGSSTDVGNTVVSDANAKVFVAGYTASSNSSSIVYPLDNDGGVPYFQGTHAGLADGCITRFDLTVAVGIDELNPDESSVSIYPNPTNNQLQVTFFNEQNTVTKMMIYNTIGEVIRSVDLGKKSGKIDHIFDVSALSTGIYFIQVQTEQGSINQKFVKQ